MRNAMGGGTRWVVSATLLALLAALTACSGTVGAGPGDVGDQPLPRQTAPQRMDVTADVSVLVSGAHHFEWTGRREIGFVRVEADVNFLSAGFEAPQPLNDDPRQRFRWGLDLIDQYHDEPAEIIVAAPAAGQISSAVYFTYMRVRDGARPTVYDWDEVELYQEYKQVDDCTLRIGDAYGSGTLHCPRLREDGGQEIRLTVDWARQ